MDSLSVITFITLAGHLIGFVGCIVCLLYFYVQLCCLFIPAIGVWNGFRISRMIGLVQRFLWLVWLTGVSLLIAMHVEEAGSFRSPLMAAKLILMLGLSLSTIGLDHIVRRLFVSVEGTRKMLVTHREANFLKLSLALSVACWGATVFVAYTYFTGLYSHGLLSLIGVILFAVVLAFLLPINNRWLNAMSSREMVSELKK